MALESAQAWLVDLRRVLCYDGVSVQLDLVGDGVSPVRILLADDDRASLRLLERSLGRWGHEVVTAGDGVEALEILEANPDICLLITDWNMPRMDGPELCRRTRELIRNKHIHIIMLTMHENKGDEILCLEAGADAFMSKPFDPHELQAHLQVAFRIIELEGRLEAKITELDNAHKALKEEIDAAGKIQRSLLPSVSPQVPYIETGWSFQSCQATAGDMLNVVRLDEHHLGLYVLDVSGHGCQAALLSVSLSRVLNPYPQQGGMLKIFTETGRRYRIPSPSEVAVELNRRFPVMRQSGQFFTFLYGILNIQTLHMTFTRAGHPAPVHYSGGRVTALDGRGTVPLGITDQAVYTDYELQLEPGDLVLFLTDGFEEARSEAGTEYGRERLINLLASRPCWGVGDAIEALKADVALFTQGTAQLDDMTVVGLSVHREYFTKEDAFGHRS